MNVFLSQARQLEAALSDPSLPPSTVRDLFPLFRRFHASIEECLEEEEWCSPKLLLHLDEIDTALQSGNVSVARSLLREIQPLFNPNHLRDSDINQGHQPSPATRGSLQRWVAPAAIFGMASVLVLTTIPSWHRGYRDPKHFTQKPADVKDPAESDSPPPSHFPVSGAALKAESPAIK